MTGGDVADRVLTFAGQAAGLVVGDFILGIDGSSKAITGNEWLEILCFEK